MQEKNTGIDWKANLGLILAAVAIFVTWWVYQSDLNAKSISVQLVSQVSLQPIISKSMVDIDFTVDGKKLEKPFLTVIQILNDGKRPITSSDFEAPLEVKLDTETKLIRAQISEKFPEQLEPKITDSPKGFLLQSTLLNPGDSIKIAVISSGGQPKFRALGRIVGIPTILFTEADLKKNNKLRLAGLMCGALVLMLTSIVVGEGALLGEGVFLRRRAALTLATGTFILSIFLWAAAMDWAGRTEFFEQIGPFIAFVPFLMAVGAWINRKLPKNGN
jgi:hypothetical protein